ncbi:hypothetical protein H1R20_g5293, partial [Candolleomyces eurysporus]
MGIAPLKTSDIFAAAYEKMKALLKWKKGPPNTNSVVPLTFFTQLLPLFFARELPQHADTNNYKAIQQLQQWIAFVASQTLPLLAAFCPSKKQKDLLTSSPSALPLLLVSLSSFPCSMSEHVICSQIAYVYDLDDKEEDVDQLQFNNNEESSPPGPSHKEPVPKPASPKKIPGTCIYSLTGSPTNLTIHPDAGLINPGLCSVPKAVKTTKRTCEDSPPVKTEKGPSNKNKCPHAEAPDTVPCCAACPQASVILSEPKEKVEAKIKVSLVKKNKAKARPILKAAKKGAAVTSSAFQQQSHNCLAKVVSVLKTLVACHRDNTDLYNHLCGFWDLAQGPKSIAYFNTLYCQFAAKWEHLRNLTALANHQATHYETTRQFLSSYVQTLKHNGDQFIDKLVNPVTF